MTVDPISIKSMPIVNTLKREENLKKENNLAEASEQKEGFSSEAANALKAQVLFKKSEN